MNLSIPFQDTLIKMDELYHTTKALIALGYYGLTETIDIYTFSFSLSENIMVGPVGVCLIVGEEEYLVNCGKDVNKTLRMVFDLRDSVSLAAGLSGYDELKKAMDKKINGEFKLTLFVSKREVYFNVYTNGYEYVIGRPITLYKESNSVANTLVLNNVLERIGSVIGTLSGRVLMLEEKVKGFDLIEEIDIDIPDNVSGVVADYSDKEKIGGFNKSTVTDKLLNSINMLLRESNVFPVVTPYNGKSMSVYEDGMTYVNNEYVGNLVDYLYSLEDEMTFISNYPRLSSWVNKVIKKRG